MAASHEILRERPEVVRTFLAVLDRAYREVAADPKGTVLEVKELMPQGSSDSLLIRSQEHLAPILLDDQGRWGHIASERWNPMAEFLITAGVIEHRFDNEFTNDYLPQ
jgi:ABC-type nitrate/sulfonate/bicarbonate transport system substrate-binding protein